MDVSTAVAFIKLMRNFFEKEYPSRDVRGFSNFIDNYEKRYVLDKPNPDTLREIGEAFLELAKKGEIAAAEMESHDTETHGR